MASGILSPALRVIMGAGRRLGRAGRLPQDGLFGGSGCAGLEIERGGFRRCS